MADVRSGRGHGTAGESPDPLNNEQIEQIEKATTVAHHGVREKKDGNPQTERNLRDLINKSQWDLTARDRLRRHAAIIAVDMERGIYKREGARNENGYSVTEIMRAMGYYVRKDGKRNTNPIIFREPEWSRAVEWERIKRDVSYRNEMEGLMPLLKIGLNAMLMQIIERAMVHPESIPDHVLFPEARKMMDMVAEFGKQKQSSELDDMAAKFMETVKHLPEGARELAMQAFQVEIRALFKSTSDIKTILTVDDRRNSERTSIAERSIIAEAS